MNVEEAEDRHPLTYAVIGAAMEVHKHLGPGLLEAFYHRAMKVELARRGIVFRSEEPVMVHDKNQSPGDDLRIDLLVHQEMIADIKSVDTVHPVHEAQLLTYMKLTKNRQGLLMSFNVKLMKNEIQRFVLSFHT